MSMKFFAFVAAALFAALFLSLSAFETVRAETLVYTATAPITKATDNISLSLPRFDPTLGILLSMEVSMTARASGTTGYENATAVPLTMGLRLDLYAEMRLPDSNLVITDLTAISDTHFLAAYDGTTDYGGPSGVSYTYSNTLQGGYGYINRFDSSHLPYIGNTLFPISFLYKGTTTVDGPLDLDSRFRSVGSLIVTVRYVYEVPRVELEKLTNGRIADGANDADVPQVNPGDVVVWTYLVTNTGSISLTLASISVTDSQAGITPVRDVSTDVGQDNLLSPGERWIYFASATAANLQVPPATITTVSGCTPPGASVPGARTTYRNIGAVTVAGLRVEDPSHYCNPPAPALTLTKYTNGHDADSPTGPIIALGDTVIWTYRITNTGNTPVIAIALVDDKIGAILCPKSDLAIGESMVCSATGIAMVGQYANVGTVTAQTPAGWPPPALPLRATNPSHYLGQGFDLALRKTLAVGQADDVKRNDLVKFTITVFNQGTVSANNIQVADTYPPGFTLADASWSDQGTYATRVIPGPLLPGRTVSVDIILRVPANPVPGTYANLAEIAAALDANGQTGHDYDSAPDLDANNDGTLKNDVIDEHRTQNPDADEDDHDIDWVRIGDYADLALRKTLAAGQSTRVNAGDLARFTVTIFNQGSATAYNIQITDYLPAGLELADGNWQAAANHSATRLIAGPLAPGASTAVEIVLRVLPNAAPQSYFNYAEISQMQNSAGQPLVDEDSLPDADPTNDGLVSNNEIEENHKLHPTADEDDHDLEGISVPEFFDLALRKTLAVGQSAVVKPGDSVEFAITVYNQGTLTATNIVVTDYLPPGFLLDDPNWQAGANNSATRSIAGPLAPNGFVVINIRLKLAAAASDQSFTNLAEISQAQGPNQEAINDQDSTPDGIADNDGVLKNDVIEENHKADLAADEDDHDSETVQLGGYADLALRKTLAAGQAADVKRNDLVKYTITIYNQGTVAASNIRIFDTFPPGFTLADPAWTNNTSYATTIITGPLAPGQSTSVAITLRVPANPAVGSHINTAEISAFTNSNGQVVSDYDSVPDGEKDNDGALKNDVIDEHHLQNPDADEDDHDIEPVRIGDYADLALQKILSPGQSREVNRNDLVKFTIKVINQGSLAANNIEITDYLPSGLQLADSNWQAGANNSATRVIPGPLAAGASTNVEIILRVAADAISQNYLNFAEISRMLGGNGQPLFDVDSTPDADQTNDGIPQNDEVNQDRKTDPNSDEDDHDLEPISVRDYFDLALRKTLAAGQSAVVRPGEPVKFVITIYNQGTLSATNVEVVDYLPAGFRLDDPSWHLVSSTMVTRLIAGPIAPNSHLAVYLNLQVEPGLTITRLVNSAEIGQASGPTQVPIADQDSTPDRTPGNDGSPKNDVIYENHLANPTNDEDDQDIEPVTIKQPTDLAEMNEPEAIDWSEMIYRVLLPVIQR